MAEAHDLENENENSVSMMKSLNRLNAEEFKKQKGDARKKIARTNENLFSANIMYPSKLGVL